MDADAAAASRIADNAFGRVRARSAERRRHPQIVALVLRRAQRVLELVEAIAVAVACEHHGISEIVDDARRSVAMLCFDGCQPGGGGDLIKPVASSRKGCFGQHAEEFPRRVGRRRPACEAVNAEHHAIFASMRTVDAKLPRSERAEAFDMVRYRRRVFRIAAAPAPRTDSLERLIDACEPGLFTSPGGPP